MADLLSGILGLSFAAGLNTYATVLALGVMQRLGMVHLPNGLDIVGSTPVIAVAASLYFIEFISDKIPLIDSIWDGIHTFIRPAAGALLAYGVVGDIAPEWQIVAGLIGGTVALTSHSAKASTRAAVNLSPEPFSNWLLSLAEDALSFLLVWLTATHPLIALTTALLLVSVAAYVVWKFSRLVRNVFRNTANGQSR